MGGNGVIYGADCAVIFISLKCPPTQERHGLGIGLNAEAAYGDTSDCTDGGAVKSASEQRHTVLTRTGHCDITLPEC